MAQWYTFNTIAGANPTDPTNYLSTGPTKPACPGVLKICAILSDDDGFGFPIIDCSLISEMAFALLFNSDRSRVALRT